MRLPYLLSSFPRFRTHLRFSANNVRNPHFGAGIKIIHKKKIIFFENFLKFFFSKLFYQITPMSSTDVDLITPSVRCGLDNNFRCGLDNTFRCGLDNTFRCGLDNTFRYGLDNTFRCGLDDNFTCGSRGRSDSIKGQPDNMR